MHHDQVGFIPGIQGWYNIHKSINMIYHITNIKEKNHLIISKDAEKAVDQIQHLFMTQTLNKIRIGGMNLNVIKAICDTATIIISGQKLQVFPLRLEVRQGCSRSPCLFTTVLQSDRKKEIKASKLEKK